MRSEAKGPHAGTMIVTGGGRGIGAAVCFLAASRGYSVIVNFVEREDTAAKVVGLIQDAGGHAVLAQGDVSQEADVIRLFEICDRTFGPPTALVNNAGISGGFSRVEDVSEKMLSDVFSINVIGSILCAREAIKRMSSKRGGAGGTITNVSSRAAQLGGSGEWVHYAATKGAIDTFTIGLAREIAAEGIRVNAVAAGIIETELHAAAGSADRIVRLGAAMPLGRAGTAEEVAEAIIWLASPAASYVTGAILPVSGGR